MKNITKIILLSGLTVAGCSLTDDTPSSISDRDIQFKVAPSTITEIIRVPFEGVRFMLRAAYTNNSGTPVFLRGRSDFVLFDLEKTDDSFQWQALRVPLSISDRDKPPQVVVQPGETLHMEWSIDNFFLSRSGLNLIAEGGLNGRYRIRVWPSLKSGQPGSSDIPEQARFSDSFTINEPVPEPEILVGQNALLVTDRLSYRPDESIEFTITNNNDDTFVYFNLCGATIEEHVNGVWREALMTAPPGGPFSCFQNLTGIRPGTSATAYRHIWIPVNQAEKYRARSRVQFGTGRAYFPIVSNSFQIEK